jgi:hypothetical protein
MRGAGHSADISEHGIAPGVFGIRFAEYSVQMPFETALHGDFSNAGRLARSVVSLPASVRS